LQGKRHPFGKRFVILAKTGGKKASSDRYLTVAAEMLCAVSNTKAMRRNSSRATAHFKYFYLKTFSI